jgi:hypothetical protein
MLSAIEGRYGRFFVVNQGEDREFFESVDKCLFFETYSFFQVRRAIANYQKTVKIPGMDPRANCFVLFKGGGGRKLYRVYWRFFTEQILAQNLMTEFFQIITYSYDIGFPYWVVRKARRRKYR